MIYVADTYNHKVKVLTPAMRTARTLTGDGRAGLADGRPGRFHEPMGLAVAAGLLFVADTNSHAIRSSVSGRARFVPSLSGDSVARPESPHVGSSSSFSIEDDDENAHGPEDGPRDDDEPPRESISMPECTRRAELRCAVAVTV